MSTETSNAPGDGRPGINRLGDSQWLDIINSPEILEAERDCDYDAAMNIAMRMTEQKMAENFAAATRGDVRWLVAKWRAIARGDRRDGDEFTANRVDACADELESALSQQPEARGVVRHDLCDCPNGRAEHSPSCAALTGERNG